MSLHLLLLNHLPPNLWNELEQSLGCYDLPIDNMHRPPSMLSVAVPTPIFCSNYGTDSFNRRRPLSTYCAAQESTHNYQPTKPSCTALSISTEHPSDHQEQESSSMNSPTSMAHGLLLQYLDSTPVPPPSTTTATKYRSSRPAANASRTPYSGSQPKSRYREHH